MTDISSASPAFPYFRWRGSTLGRSLKSKERDGSCRIQFVRPPQWSEFVRDLAFWDSPLAHQFSPLQHATPKDRMRTREETYSSLPPHYAGRNTTFTQPSFSVALPELVMSPSRRLRHKLVPEDVAALQRRHRAIHPRPFSWKSLKGLTKLRSFCAVLRRSVRPREAGRSLKSTSTSSCRLRRPMTHRSRHNYRNGLCTKRITQIG